jgi:hypothetical protein
MVVLNFICGDKERSMDRERYVNIFVRGRMRIVLIVVPIMRKEEKKQMERNQAINQYRVILRRIINDIER